MFWQKDAKNQHFFGFFPRHPQTTENPWNENQKKKNDRLTEIWRCFSEIDIYRSQKFVENFNRCRSESFFCVFEERANLNTSNSVSQNFIKKTFCSKKLMIIEWEGECGGGWFFAGNFTYYNLQTRVGDFSKVTPPQSFRGEQSSPPPSQHPHSHTHTHTHTHTHRSKVRIVELREGECFRALWK